MKVKYSTIRETLWMAIAIAAVWALFCLCDAQAAEASPVPPELAALQARVHAELKADGLTPDCQVRHDGRRQVIVGCFGVDPQALLRRAQAALTRAKLPAERPLRDQKLAAFVLVGLTQ